MKQRVFGSLFGVLLATAIGIAWHGSSSADPPIQSTATDRAKSYALFFNAKGVIVNSPKPTIELSAHGRSPKKPEPFSRFKLNFHNMSSDSRYTVSASVAVRYVLNKKSPAGEVYKCFTERSFDLKTARYSNKKSFDYQTEKLGYHWFGHSQWHADVHIDVIKNGKHTFTSDTPLRYGNPPDKLPGC